jgi:hypothetical protein
MKDDYLGGHKGEWIMPPDELERVDRLDVLHISGIE